MRLPFSLKSSIPYEEITTEQILEGQVFLVDKPLGWSSFQVVNKLKYDIKKHHQVSKKFKIGHAGTLDPLASGLLIICTGKKTKEIESFQGLEKEYTGTITLGATTPSYDLETEIDEVFPTEHITQEDIEKAVAELSGEIKQYPPIFSAVKIDGQRAYKAARKGLDIQVRPRIVEISKFEIDTSEFPKIHFRVVCSKGTYIRSLAYDFGRLLNNGAHLSALRRERIGEFCV